MTRLSRLLRTVLHPMLLLGTGAALAQSAPPPHAQPRPPAQQQRDRNEDGGLRDSVRRVERQTGGEVLRAEPMQRDGREVYRLKVLTSDGRVRVVQDDPDRPPPEAKGKGKPKGKEQSSRDSDEEPPQ
jgi:hypothetical protein